MIMQDDRTAEERQTHTHIVAMTDRWMSGWGQATGGTSIAAWACRPGDADRVYRWVANRGDGTRVRQVSDPYRPRGTGHCHIYVVTDKHPALP